MRASAHSPLLVIPFHEIGLQPFTFKVPHVLHAYTLHFCIDGSGIPAGWQKTTGLKGMVILILEVLEILLLPQEMPSGCVADPQC
jgi:hypothetical protein